MDIIEWEHETMLESYVRLGLVPASALPESWRRVAEETGRAKRAQA